MTERDRIEQHETTEDTPMAGMPPDRGSPPSTPRWVKVFGIIALVLVVLLVIVMLFGGGSHGPGRHIPSGDVVETPSGDLGGHTPLIEHRMQQP